MPRRNHFVIRLFTLLTSFALFTISGCDTRQPSQDEVRAKMIARAAELELDTKYEAPPGDPLSHHTAGLAKVVCSAVFITGLTPEFAVENLGYFVSPYEERSKVGKPVVDYEKKTISIALPNGVVRKAIYTGDQGCVCLPEGIDSLYYRPIKVERHLPDPATTPWPMGDLPSADPVADEVDMKKVEEAVQAAFEPAEALTAAFVVTYKGKIIGERYGEGITKDTPLESWSMGKSLTATLMGVLIQQGVYKLDQPAPFPQWQGEGDERSKIRIMDIMRMSSGLRFRAPQDPEHDPTLGYADHLYVYTGGINSFDWIVTRPQQWPPNTIGRYRNSDPGLINYLTRLGVEGRGEVYHTFPQRALFDKIGVRSMVMEADPYGNFLTQGYELASARDWARLGNLYLQDGVWNGERILPEGFAQFVSTLAPAWVADGRPIYGGFFWINGDERLPIPKESYMMLGAGGQSTTIISSHNLVIVRLGHYKGSSAGDEALRKAYTLLMEAVPANN